MWATRDLKWKGQKDGSPYLGGRDWWGLGSTLAQSAALQEPQFPFGTCWQTTQDLGYFPWAPVGKQPKTWAIFHES